MSHSTPVGDRAPQIGQVWQWHDRKSSPLRVTRIREAGWTAVRLRPEPWEEPGQEWLLHWRQIEAGRYVRLSPEEIAAFEDDPRASVAVGGSAQKKDESEVDPGVGVRG